MMLFSRKWLQRILGTFWLIDGLLQLQPQMFTVNMVNGVMKPILQGQPGLIEPGLQFTVAQTTLHLVIINLLIAIVQILLGLGFLLLSDQWIKQVVILSTLWALVVWYAGEGMSMLFTGQASILTGAPGAVLFYSLLGLVIYPRKRSRENAKEVAEKADEEGLLTRSSLRLILACFWVFAALLQLQPSWWQPGQISQTVGVMVGQGGLNTSLVDPVLQQISGATGNVEVPLNVALIAIFLALGIALAVVKEEQVRFPLIASMVMSLVLWYLTEAFGMILTGMATDFNSGLLVAMMTLACWPKSIYLSTAQARFMRSTQQTQELASTRTV